MDYAMQDAILREAERLYGFSQIINIIVKVAPCGLMYAVYFMDGYGMPKEQLTGWHSNPTRLLDTLKAKTK